MTTDMNDRNLEIGDKIEVWVKTGAGTVDYISEDMNMVGYTHLNKKNRSITMRENVRKV